MRRGLIFFILLLLFPMRVQASEVPEDIKAYCEEIGAEYAICPELLEAIAYTESGFQQYAVNSAGTCHGLCQIYVGCHRARMKRLGVTDIYDKRGNILVAADLLSDLFEQYEDVGAVLMAYNGASTAQINRYIETGNLPRYAETILNQSMKYEEGEQ